MGERVESMKRKIIFFLMIFGIFLTGCQNTKEKEQGTANIEDFMRLFQKYMKGK